MCNIHVDIFSAVKIEFHQKTFDSFNTFAQTYIVDTHKLATIYFGSKIKTIRYKPANPRFFYNHFK